MKRCGGSGLILQVATLASLLLLASPHAATAGTVGDATAAQAAPPLIIPFNLTAGPRLSGNVLEMQLDSTAADPVSIRVTDREGRLIIEASRSLHVGPNPLHLRLKRVLARRIRQTPGDAIRIRLMETATGVTTTYRETVGV